MLYIGLTHHISFPEAPWSLTAGMLQELTFQHGLENMTCSLIINRDSTRMSSTPPKPKNSAEHLVRCSCGGHTSLVASSRMPEEKIPRKWVMSQANSRLGRDKVLQKRKPVCSERCPTERWQVSCVNGHCEGLWCDVLLPRILRLDWYNCRRGNLRDK